MATESQPGRTRNIVIGNSLRVRILHAVVVCLTATGFVGVDCASALAQSQPVVRVAKRAGTATAQIQVEKTQVQGAKIRLAPVRQTQARNAQTHQMPVPVHQTRARQTRVQQAPVHQAPVHQAPVHQAHVPQVPVLSPVRHASGSSEPGASEQVVRMAVRGEATSQNSNAVEIVQVPPKAVPVKQTAKQPAKQATQRQAPQIRNTPDAIVPIERVSRPTPKASGEIPIVSVDRPRVVQSPGNMPAPATGSGVVNVAKRRVASAASAQLNSAQLRADLQKAESRSRVSQPTSLSQLAGKTDAELADPGSYLVKSQLPLNIRSFDERRRNFERKLKKNRTPASSASYRKYSRSYQDVKDEDTDKKDGQEKGKDSDKRNGDKRDKKGDRDSEAEDDFDDDDALNFEIASVNVPLGDTPLGKLNPRNDAGVPYNSDDLPTPSEQSTKFQEAHYSPMTQAEMTDQMYTPKSYAWNAPNLYHRPLYFEERNLERYGQKQPFQSIRSGAHFFATIPILPYKIGAYPLNECTYSYGYHRPGNCNPNRKHQLPWSPRGLLYEAAAVSGAVLVIP